MKARQSPARNPFLVIAVASAFVALAAVLGMTASGPAAFAQESCEGPRLAYDFPFVLRGAPALFGAQIGRVSGYRNIKGRWEQVQVQIDEINGAGDYVLENGLPFTAGTGDGVYNGKDELTFEGRSLGDDFEDSMVPAELRNVSGRLWKLKFCKAGNYFGSILIRSGDAASSVVYASGFREPAVKYQENPAQIVSDIYRYDFHPTNPVLLGQLWLKSDSTATGKPVEHQVIEKSSFVMPLRLPWWAPNFSLSDSNFKSSIECWRSGPVRTIVAVGVKFKSFLSLFNLHMFSELVFYRNKFQVPTVIQFSFDPSSYLKQGSGLFYSITFPEGRGWEVETNLVDLPKDPPRSLPGEAGRPSALDQDVFYARGTRPEGSFEVNVRVDPEARRLVPPPYFIRKQMFSSRDHQKSWPEITKKGGDMGVYLDISGVRTGIYDFGLDLVLSREASQRLRDYGSVEARWTQIEYSAGPPAK